jgi:hypothetical protein
MLTVLQKDIGACREVTVSSIVPWIDEGIDVPQIRTNDQRLFDDKPFPERRAQRL